MMPPYLFSIFLGLALGISIGVLCAVVWRFFAGLFEPPKFYEEVKGDLKIEDFLVEGPVEAGDYLKVGHDGRAEKVLSEEGADAIAYEASMGGVVRAVRIEVVERMEI